MMTTAHLPQPTLEIREGTPVSAAFGDVYFSREGAVAETQHVFLAGNRLPERWESSELQRFSVAELGFGTGANFLVTLRAFYASAQPDARLEYHAVEKFPFRPDALAEVLAAIPELGQEADALLRQYPLPLPGPHVLRFGRVVLHLWFGEAREWLAALPETSIDAWYLDGFAPAKNPDMWSEDILQGLARASADAATFATFTAATAVRRGLEAAGFEVEKAPGFGKKRDMLRGQMRARDELLQHTPRPRRLRDDVSVVVIGAGIAGASVARALAERGARVTMLERAEVASGASGNQAGVLYPPLTKHWSLATAFYFAAYAHMLRNIARWQGQGLAFEVASPGMLRLPRHAEEQAQLSQLGETLQLDPSIVRWMEREEASARAGVALATGGAFYPQGTWLSPAQLCRALLQHENIILREKTAVRSIQKTGAGWQVTLEDGEAISAQIVCVVSAVESAHLLGEYGLSLNPVGGQVTQLMPPAGAPMLRSIVCRKGYVIPVRDALLVGATYHREDFFAVTQTRHVENIAELTTILPDWCASKVIGGRSSIRATTPDRLPYIGALEDGLYVSTGHGSRGLLSAPLAAEMIASEMYGEPSPVIEAHRALVHPRRRKR